MSGLPAQRSGCLFREYGPMVGRLPSVATHDQFLASVITRAGRISGIASVSSLSRARAFERRYR
jgi:hypothetical protein